MRWTRENILGKTDVGKIFLLGHNLELCKGNKLLLLQYYIAKVMKVLGGVVRVFLVWKQAARSVRPEWQALTYQVC